MGHYSILNLDNRGFMSWLYVTALYFSTTKRDFEIIVNNKFQISDYLNNLNSKKEDQNINQDNNLDYPKNFDKTSDKNIFINSNNKSEIRSAKK